MLDVKGNIRPHGGSDFANEMQTALDKHADIAFSKDPSQKMLSGVAVNTQVLGFVGTSGCTIQMTAGPQILYGDRNHPEEESSCGFWGAGKMDEYPIPPLPSP